MWEDWREGTGRRGQGTGRSKTLKEEGGGHAGWGQRAWLEAPASACGIPGLWPPPGGPLPLLSWHCHTRDKPTVQVSVRQVIVTPYLDTE